MRVHASIHTNVVQIAGYEEHPQIRFNDGEMLRQLAAIHARHDHVGQEEVHMTVLLCGSQTSFDPVSRFEDLIAGFGQLVPDQGAHPGIVFDE